MKAEERQADKRRDRGRRAWYKRSSKEGERQKKQMRQNGRREITNEKKRPLTNLPAGQGSW